MIEKEELISIGEFRRPHGIHGEISVWIATEMFEPEMVSYIVCDIDGIFVPFFIEQIRSKGKETYLFQIKGVESETDAAILNHKEVFINRQMIRNPEKVFTWSDLEGYTISDANDLQIGTIRTVDESTLNVLFEVETTDGLFVLLPVSEEIVVSFDQEHRSIAIDIPEGLLDL